MSDGWREIGRVPYVTGFEFGGGEVSRPLIVGIDAVGMVTIGDPEEPIWHLTADAREHFQRVFMDAERAAEAAAGADADPEVIDAEVWCELEGGCLQGPPGTHLSGPSCQTEAEAAGEYGPAT